MSVIGQTFSRKKNRGDGRDKIRVTGQVGSFQLIAEEADQFSAPFTLTATELAMEYGGHAEPALNEEAAQQALTAAAHKETLRSLAQNPRYTRGTAATPASDSPEGQFAAAAAEAENADWRRVGFRESQPW